MRRGRWEPEPTRSGRFGFYSENSLILQILIQTIILNRITRIKGWTGFFLSESGFTRFSGFSGLKPNQQTRKGFDFDFILKIL